MTGTLIGVTAERIRLQVAAPRAAASSAAVTVKAGRFGATIPLRHDPWQMGTTPLPSGSYRLQCVEEIGDTHRTEVTVHVEQRVIETFPVQFDTGILRGQVGLMRAWPRRFSWSRRSRTASVERVAAGTLQLALRGRLSDPDYEFGSVLMRSYYGELAA